MFLNANPNRAPIAIKSVCEACGDLASSRCGRCKLVCYCSTACQKKDIRQHKQICKAIAKLQKKVEEEEAKIRRLCWKDGAISIIENEGEKSILETSAGSFGPYGIEEAYPYIDTRALLARQCNNLAFAGLEHPTLPIWKEVCNMFQECLRLNANDDFSLGASFPFVLMNCNRDDDAYVFCLRRLKHENDWECHKDSKEGDWIYGDGNRYSDVIEKDDSLCFGLPYLVAVLIVKLRLIAAFDAKKKRGRAEILEEEERKIQDVRETQIPFLLDLIHARNPTMLPALVNPVPLLSQPLPGMCAHGKPCEALNILMNAIGPFNRTDGAKEILIERFGRHPAYDADCSNPFGF